MSDSSRRRVLGGFSVIEPSTGSEDQPDTGCEKQQHQQVRQIVATLRKSESCFWGHELEFLSAKLTTLGLGDATY